MARGTSPRQASRSGPTCSRATHSRRSPPSTTSSTSCSSTPRRTTTSSCSSSRVPRSSRAPCSSPTTSLSHEELKPYSAARQADPTLESVTVPLDRGLEAERRPALTARCSTPTSGPATLRATAERRWSGSEFRLKYGQWRYQRVEVRSPGPTGNRLASVGDDATRAARHSRSRTRLCRIQPGIRREGRASGPLFLLFLPVARPLADGDRNGLGRERLEDEPEPLEELGVEQPALVVELLVHP